MGKSIRSHWMILKSNLSVRQVGLGVLWIGFLIGIYMGTLTETVGFSKEGMRAFFVEKTAVFSFSAEEYFFYLLGRRIGQAILVFFVPTMLGGRMLYPILMMAYGGGIGLYLSGLMRYYSMRGVLLFGGSFFPQAFFYVPCFLLITELGLECMEKDGKYDIIKRKQTKGKQCVIYLKKIGLIILLEMGGILTESYWNPGILEALLNT